MISRPKAYLFFVWLSLLLTFAISGCNDSSESGSNANSNPGGVTFSLSWKDIPLQGAKSARPQLVTDDICADYQIEWIHAQAIDQSGGEPVRAMWACALGHGTLENVPVGTYRIVIEGEVAGENTWRGEAADVQVIKDETTDAGSIRMVHQTDQVAPTVVETLPADSALDVAVTSTVSATFDDTIVGHSIGTDNFMLTYTDHMSVITSVDCTVAYEPGTRMAVLSPSVALINDTIYTATIAVDRTLVVEDLAGNPMQQAKQWTFTTFRPDIEGPNIISRAPAAAEMDVAYITNVEFEFSEPVQPETITASSIYLQYEGATVQCTLSFDERQNKVTLTPTDALRAGSTYTVVATSAITDLANNPLQVTESWSFVTRFAPWRHESVSGAISIAATAIALESNERIHISYLSLQGQMEDAIRSSENTFNSLPLSGTSAVYLHQDMVIDPLDTQHIVYRFADETRLTVCSEGLEVGGSVRCNRIDDSNDLLGFSIAVNNGLDGMTSGETSICYYDGNGAIIKYAAETSNWIVETIDNGGGQNPSFALAPTGAVHVSYISASTNQLKYATKLPGGSWIKEFVDPSVSAGRYSDIAVGRSGNPHISYQDVDSGDLKYATKQPSGNWLIETVDPDHSTNTHRSSIVLDALDNAHVSYVGGSQSVLKYASRTSLGLWHTHIVDDRDVGTTGTGSSIIVDSRGDLHISYLHIAGLVNGGLVRYATTSPLNQ